MKKIKGLYRIKTPYQIEEKHGGVTIVDSIFWYLAFYKKDKLVGFYGSSGKGHSTYASKGFELVGNYTIDANRITFKIKKLYTDEFLDFSGIISKDKKEISIQIIKESDNGKKWIDDTFEKVEIDEVS